MIGPIDHWIEKKLIDGQKKVLEGDELAKAKDFGQYADAASKDIVVSFISSNDITGGNSGSPVINAKGELIGLAFDGNYEALSHKLAFDKNLNRTICVDVIPFHTLKIR